MNINRPQRFGTQFRSDAPENKWHLYKMDPDVTDPLRKAMNCPTLDQAKKREAEMQKQTGGG